MGVVPARRAAKARGMPVNVYLRDGTYYLSAPLVFTPADSGTKEAPVIYQSHEKEKPVTSGGMKLTGSRPFYLESWNGGRFVVERVADGPLDAVHGVPHAR